MTKSYPTLLSLEQRNGRLRRALSHGVAQPVGSGLPEDWLAAIIIRRLRCGSWGNRGKLNR